jgi:hypothetical protein
MLDAKEKFIKLLYQNNICFVTTAEPDIDNYKLPPNSMTVPKELLVTTTKSIEF